MNVANLSLPPGLVALLGGLLLLYAAAQTLTGAISHAMVHSPVRRAFWYAMLIGAPAIVATFLGHGEIALGIVTGSSIAALSLVPGVCGSVSSATDGVPTGDSLCGLLLAPAVLLWLIGLRAEINWLSGVFLAVQAILLMAIFRGTGESKKQSFLFRIVLFLALCVAVAASVLAVRGALSLQSELNTLTPAIFAAAIVSPILILPFLGECVRLTEEHRAGEARTMQVGIAMVLITTILPVCVLIAYVLPHFAPTVRGGALPFPYGTWRVDCVILIILAGWVFSNQVVPRSVARLEGALLILLYAAYLISLAIVGQYL